MVVAPERERVTASDVCTLAQRWRVREDVMQRVMLLACQFEAETGLQLQIISGHRTHEEQDMLRLRGRPAARDELSTHRSLPATGVDLSIGAIATPALKATFGRIAVSVGLRWGGGSPVDAETGIPSDWNHVDVGPRSQSP